MPFDETARLAADGTSASGDKQTAMPAAITEYQTNDML